MGFFDGGTLLFALVLTIGLRPVSSSTIRAFNFLISSSCLVMLRLRTSFERTCYVKFFRQLRRVKILGVFHLTKELFAPAGKFYPIGFEAPSKPCIEVLFHTTKIRKRNGSTKFNKLRINGLKAICRLSNELDTLLFGGLSRKSLRASLCLQNGSNRLIFNGLKARYAVQ